MAWVLGEQQVIQPGRRAFYGVTPTPGNCYVWSLEGVNSDFQAAYGVALLVGFELGSELFSEVEYARYDQRGGALRVCIPASFPAGLTWVYYRTGRSFAGDITVKLWYDDGL